MSVKVIRTHEICAGHRVVGHESKCRHLHGHNYVFHFEVAPKREKRAVTVPITEGSSAVMQLESPERTKLDDLGRVIDFSVVKSTLCEWLENNWDHRFLHWENDPLFKKVRQCIHHEIATGEQDPCEHTDAYFGSLVSLPFNPTAENLAAHMVNVIGPELLDPYGVELIACRIEETSKCHVEYTK
ncbi:queuosine biosynthesis protein [Enterobacter phage EC151]|nr:queuosine biosynthesis protein [Enterobacter phage EC151]